MTITEQINFIIKNQLHSIELQNDFSSVGRVQLFQVLDRKMSGAIGLENIVYRIIGKIFISIIYLFATRTHPLLLYHPDGVCHSPQNSYSYEKMC